jgi:hypothetical protein
MGCAQILMGCAQILMGCAQLSCRLRKTATGEE